MKSIIRACIAMVAFAAFFMMPSIASAGPILEAPTGTVYNGTYIEAENVGVIRLTTSVGIIECAAATMTGDLTTNSGGHMSGDIETAEFKGTAASPATAHCPSPIGNLTVTPNHAEDLIGSLPWCITARTNDDKFTVRGGRCTEAERALKFTLDTPVGACAYSKASVTGSYTTHPSDAVLSFSEQEFKKAAGSIFCPGNLKLDMSFTLRTDDANTQPIYIGKV